jgi:hypothetical protein
VGSGTIGAEVILGCQCKGQLYPLSFFFGGGGGVKAVTGIEMEEQCHQSRRITAKG